jgi:hypothetical protein
MDHTDNNRFGWCEGWRDVAAAFLRSGEASTEFIEHLANCETCQAAVDRAFDAQVKAFKEIARILKKLP